MAKKSRKPRAQPQRENPSSALAEKLDAAPITVPPASGVRSVRHSSGMHVRVERSRSPVLESLLASELEPRSVPPAPASVPPASGIIAIAIPVPVPVPVLAPTPADPPAEPREENRISPRVSLNVDIHLASHSHFFSGLSGDISEGGLFLSTYRPLPLGSPVDLEFSLPGSDRTLRARGRVRWLREHSSFGPRGVGISFDELSPEDRKRIHDFCSIRPPLYYDDLG